MPDALHRTQRIFGGHDVLEQQGELVSTDPGNRVGLAHRGLQARGNLLQDLVAGEMSEGVVHGLEVVEIDEHDRQGPVVAPLAFESVVQPVCEENPVHESRKWVVERLAGEVDLASLELGHRGLEPAVQAAVVQQSLKLPRHHESRGRGTDREQDRLPIECPVTSLTTAVAPANARGTYGTTS